MSCCSWDNPLSRRAWIWLTVRSKSLVGSGGVTLSNDLHGSTWNHIESSPGKLWGILHHVIDHDWLHKQPLYSLSLHNNHTHALTCSAVSCSLCSITSTWSSNTFYVQISSRARLKFMQSAALDHPQERTRQSKKDQLEVGNSSHDSTIISHVFHEDLPLQWTFVLGFKLLWHHTNMF